MYVGVCVCVLVCVCVCVCACARACPWDCVRVSWCERPNLYLQPLALCVFVIGGHLRKCVRSAEVSACARPRSHLRIYLFVIVRSRVLLAACACVHAQGMGS